MIRYIHLNPLRAGLVTDIDKLARYPFSGHGVVMGKKKNDWQDTAYVLNLFADQKTEALHSYKAYIAEGIEMGKRPDLTGGGLIRSSGGWSEIKSARKTNTHIKSDERILGDSDFVAEVLKAADESLHHRYALKAKGWIWRDWLKNRQRYMDFNLRNFILQANNPPRSKPVVCFAIGPPPNWGLQ